MHQHGRKSKLKLTIGKRPVTATVVKEEPVIKRVYATKASVVKSSVVRSSTPVIKRNQITRTLSSRLQPTGNGRWSFDSQMGANREVGFIYVIKNLTTGRLYLGKKLFVGFGKLNKGQESNWRSYVSSNKEIQEDIKANGDEHLEFICLEQYMSKGALAYAETWSLCFVEAPTLSLWINKRVEAISWTVKEPISARHKERLAIIKAGDSFIMKGAL
jgi:hypothetical protein